MRDAILDSRTAWVRLAVALAASIIGSAGIWVVIPIVPAVEAEFGTLRAGAAFPQLIVMAGFALGNMAMGRAVDRFGITSALVAGGAILCLGYVLAVLAASFGLFASAHLLIGFGSAVAFGPLVADVSHWFWRHRGLAVSIVASGNYIAGALWPMLFAGVIETQGWRAFYLWMAGLTLGLVLPLAWRLRHRLPVAAATYATTQADANRAASGLSSRALVALLIVAGFACCTAMAMPQVHIVALCADMGFTAAIGTQMLSLMLLGGVISRVASGFVADRLGGLRTLVIGSLAQCLALFLYLGADGLTSLYVVTLIFGLSQGGIVPMYAVLVRDYLPSHQAGASVGAVLTATIVGMAFGGWASGWIFDLTGSYQMAFLHGIGWNFVNLGIALLLLMRFRPRGQPLAA